MQNTEEAMRLVNADRLQSLVADMLEWAGASAENAAIVARALVAADARGMNSHGMIRLPVYIRRLRQGGFDGKATGSVIAETAATMLIDGQNGLGAPLTMRAMEHAIDKARGSGIAAVGVRNSNHNGEGAFYAMRAIEADMVGIATTNGSPIMPVWGGKTKFTGPLPVSVGAPAAEEKPILLDAALGMSSRGKILYFAEKGRELPDGWLVDAEGRPTNDPRWINEGGWILPIGGHKGFGLILVCEILSGLLTGGKFGSELRNLYSDLDTGQGNGHFVIAIDIAAFVPVAEFKARMDAFIRTMKASELAPGFEQVLMPGEIEFDKEAHQRAHGIALEPKVVREVEAVARELGLSPDL